MAETYDQHKARVDAVMPIPTFAWGLFSEDTPHIHDDRRGGAYQRRYV